jgi:hypothetical protein
MSCVAFSYPVFWCTCAYVNHPPFSSYTSLGSTANTIQNPHLRIKHPDTAEVEYLPAYMLKDGTLERAGRLTKKSEMN